ncbi:MAG: hypothetical protein SX243_02350 [Acidobacteriota bacterium]|nr:hypothetical protein [Acidobacteriota bacterium]
MTPKEAAAGAGTSRREGRFLRGAVRLTLGLVVVALLITGGRWLFGGSPATGDAQWIWAPSLDPANTEPAVYFAFRDFQLDARPEQARLLIQAEEEYRVWINGRPVGSNVFHQQAPLDVYRIEKLLLPGGNRLLVELRSSFGGGGLLASLEAGGEDGELRPVVVTDGAWRVSREWQPGLLGGWTSPQEAEPVRVWGRPPIGRWGVPKLGPERPVTALLKQGSMLPKPWVASLQRESPVRAQSRWEEPVVGYLSLELEPGSGRIGLVVPAQDEPAVAVMVALGASRWVDARPRRWRRAEILGLDGVVAASVLELPPATRSALLSPAELPPSTLLGIHTPPSPTPLHQRVRRILRDSSS